MADGWLEHGAAHSMNLAALVGQALRAIPTGIKGPVTVKQLGTELSFTAPNGVVLPVDADKVMDATLDISRMRRILLAPGECTFEPVAKDKVVVEGHTWSVVAPATLNPSGVAGAAALYDFMVKR